MNQFHGLPNIIHIQTAGDSETIQFAANELARYLHWATGISVSLEEPTSPATVEGLRVGETTTFPHLTTPTVPDNTLDDTIVIQTQGPSGFIAGNNPRAVLLAVYRYLRELGCRWVRPGATGEFIPHITTLPAVSLHETPSYRHRGLCIEGAVSYEHVRDTVDWLPKIGFNSYFIQFREAHTFFNRWYAHVGNPILQGETLSVEKAREYASGIESEIRKRGLLYHKVGHGWTCEPFGIAGLGWETESTDPSPDIARFFALVKGERKLWGGVALNTNLCYSNPEVRHRMADAIAQYAAEHPDVDYLHIWLADGSNNNCECEHCRISRPSDFYVQMLNEADEALTRAALKTRLVFLIYVDLLWPPEHEHFHNPDRFVLMFAPIARTYSQTFRVSDKLPPLPPYERNQLKFPADVDSNIAFLKAWQALFNGDSFDFDYHLMWDHVHDPGHMSIAHTIANDMRGLRDIGINGYISCQIQRVHFPTAISVTAMASFLWNRDADFDALADDYFAAAFGDEAQACRAYLASLSDLFDPVYLRGEKTSAHDQAILKLSQAHETITAFLPTIERNLSLPNPCQAESWRLLKHHADLSSRLAHALIARAQGDKPTASALWKETALQAWRLEPELHHVFDAWLYTMRLDRYFRLD